MTQRTWKGRHFVDGEHIDDVRNKFDAVEVPIWQLCDQPLRIREGDAVGYAILESTLIGEVPDLTTPRSRLK